jgi:DNA topoisomerase-6 subunit B
MEKSNLKEHSVAEFFKKNRHMLGLYGKLRSLTTIIHEFVANSIDACEESNILPDIEVKIVKLGEEHFEVHVIDNGPGLSEQNIGKALGKLLAGTKFHRQIQMRGQQGIGASGCILFSQMTTGKQVKVISGNKGKVFYAELGINVAKNEPELKNLKYIEKDFKGLAISAEFKEIDYQDSNQNAFEYLKRTALANPHVTIKYLDPFEKLHIFERSVNTLPKIPLEVKPHIKSVNTDLFLNSFKLSNNNSITAHIKENFDRTGDRFIQELQENLKDLDLKKITKRNIDFGIAEKIVKAIQKVKTIAPRTDALIPIGEEQLKASITSILKPESLHVITRKPTTYKGGFPFQIDCAIAYGGDCGRKLKDGSLKSEIMRFSNRTPLLFDQGACAITSAINAMEWKRYNIKDFDNSPITILINLSSVHIPYTNVGKQAVADEQEIIDEIKLAIMTVARAISTHISRKHKVNIGLETKRMFAKYNLEIAFFLHQMLGLDKKEVVEKLNKLIDEKLELDKLNDKLEKEKEDIEKVSKKTFEEDYSEDEERDENYSNKKTKNKKLDEFYE